jgi:hypothetical protein
MLKVTGSPEQGEGGLAEKSGAGGGVHGVVWAIKKELLHRNTSNKLIKFLKICTE